MAWWQYILIGGAGIVFVNAVLFGWMAYRDRAMFALARRQSKLCSCQSSASAVKEGAG